MISQSTDYFITCYTVLTRPNKVEAFYVVSALHHCFLNFEGIVMRKTMIVSNRKIYSCSFFLPN